MPLHRAMKFLVLSVATIAAGQAAAAASTDSVVLAAMRLAEQPNYSWSVTVEDHASAYAIEGRTERDGLSWMRLPVVKQVAKRLGRNADTEVEAVFADPYAFVLRTQEGWLTWNELPKRHPDWREEAEYWVIPRQRSDSWGTPVALAPNSPDPISALLHAPLPPSHDTTPYSNAQFALSLPHEELAVIVSSFSRMEVGERAAVGVLTGVGAQLLLVREGQRHLSVGEAAGVFKLHYAGGLVTRYQLRLEGYVFVEGERVLVRQTSTTHIRDIGRTQVGVAEEARRKLLAAR